MVNKMIGNDFVPRVYTGLPDQTCSECGAVWFRTGQTYLASVKDGKVKKWVCGQECAKTFDARIWQRFAILNQIRREAKTKEKLMPKELREERELIERLSGQFKKLFHQAWPDLSIVHRVRQEDMLKAQAELKEFEERVMDHYGLKFTLTPSFGTRIEKNGKPYGTQHH